MVDLWFMCPLPPSAARNKALISGDTVPATGLVVSGVPIGRKRRGAGNKVSSFACLSFIDFLAYCYSFTQAIKEIFLWP